MPSNEVFCIRPWTQTCIRSNGDISLCCNSIEQSQHNIKTSDLTEWWNSDYLKDVRQRMLSDTTLPECINCYNEEDAGGISLRQLANKEYKIIEKYADKLIEHLRYPTSLPIEMELQLTNLCNLKCLMCNETDSSAILSENKILKISTTHQTDYRLTDEIIDKIKLLLHNNELRLLNFRGGEPLMAPQIKQLIRYGIDNELFANTKIHISTNATKLDSEWLNYFSKIDNLRVMVSIEAVGPLNDYIRYGSNWNEVENNIKLLSQLSNVELIIHCTVQNLNILHIDELINWSYQNNYYLEFSVLTDPEIFRFDNLPPTLLAGVQKKLKTIKDNPHKINELNTLLMEKKQFDNQLYLEFKKEILLRDTVRNLSIYTVLPELINT